MKISLFALSTLALLSATLATDTTTLDQTASLTQSPSANNRKLIINDFSICDNGVTRAVGLFTFLFHLFTFQIFAEIGECEATAPACAALSASCTMDAECCSGNCDGSSCAPPCTALSESCVMDADCCSGNCGGSSCALCMELGAGTCKFDTDCCSNSCEDASCVACVSGESCNSDDDCCDQTEGCMPSDQGGLFCQTCARQGFPCGPNVACCVGVVCNAVNGGFECGF